MAEVPKRKIKFNPDKTVTVTTPGGQNFNFSKDEYKRYNEQIGGGSKNLSTPTTPKVKAAVQIQKANEQARNVAAGNATVQVPQATQAPQAPQVSAQGLPVQPQVVPTAPTQQIPQIQLPQVQPQATPTLTQGLVNPSVQQGVQGVVSDLQQQGFAQGVISSPLLAPKIIKLVAKEALEISSAIKSFVGGDTQNVKNIKNQYNDIKSGLDKQITAISQGYGDPQTLLENYQLMVNAVQQLEIETKRRGIDNLPYWISLKKEGLQSDIQGMKAQLDGMTVDIESAVIQGNQKRQQRYLQELQAQATQEATVLQ